MKNPKIVFTLAALAFLSLSAFGQDHFFLNMKREGTAKYRISYKKEFANANERDVEVQNVLNAWYETGFLEARCDSVIGDSLNRTAYVFRGDRYKLSSIKPSTQCKIVCENTGFKPGKSGHGKFSEYALKRYLDEALQWFENNAYPFARAYIDSVELDGNKVNAKLFVEPGNRIIIDSLIRKGNVRISRNYMYRYLGMRPGSPYDESRIRKITQRLEDLPFITVVKPFEVAFWTKEARIYLYLNKKKASHFSGVLGVLPNSQASGKLMINGDVKLYLLNSFAQGELIELNWRSLEKGTQDLRLHLNYPFLLGTPLGIDYDFKLYKKDTSYLTTTHRIGIPVQFAGNNGLMVFADLFRSDIIRASGLESLSVLPNFADISTNLFGLSVNYTRLDYRLNPRKGYHIDFSASGGGKKIRKNDKINPQLYDSLDLNTAQVHGGLDFQYFVPLFKRQTLLFGFSSALIWNEFLFDNELIRIGGLKSLRGFDEESIKASTYASLLIEYRYFFERNSFLAVFWNGAFIESNTVQSYVSDLPYGLGAGVSFDTRIGIFSLYYALGAQNHNPILLKQSKIHFGITARF